MALRCRSGSLDSLALRWARLHVIDRCGHSLALEKPQEFLPAVQDFLSMWD
jgi:pimeloyl-ACP methyl ester carboxylesterase